MWKLKWKWNNFLKVNMLFSEEGIECFQNWKWNSHFIIQTVQFWQCHVKRQRERDLKRKMQLKTTKNKKFQIKSRKDQKNQIPSKVCDIFEISQNHLKKFNLLKNELEFLILINHSIYNMNSIEFNEDSKNFIFIIFICENLYCFFFFFSWKKKNKKAQFWNEDTSISFIVQR